MTRVKPIPDGYHSVTPYLCVSGAEKAIEFYKKAFGATEVFRMQEPGGKIGHAEIEIDGTRLMLADEYPDWGFRAPAAYGGTPVTMHLYVKDVDAVYARAVEAGAKPLRPVIDQFYGDRSGALEDPFGHIWHVATHTEDLTPDQIRERAVSARPGSQG